MIREEAVMDLTMAYLYSYKLALAETKNQNLATTVAYGVTTIIAQKNDPVKKEEPETESEPTEPPANFAQIVMGAFMRKMEEAEQEADDGETE